MVFDDFSSDTIANYNTVGDPVISDGVIELSGSKTAIHDDSQGTLCVTAKLLKLDINNYSTYLLLSQNPSWALTADIDGYFLRFRGSTYNYWQLYRYIDGSALVLGTGGDTCDGWIFGRLYRDGANIIARCGQAALDVSVSTNDETWEADLYAGVRSANPANQADNLECRTSHLITCTGLPDGYWFKVADAVLETGTEAKAQASSGTATVDAGAVLFPLYWVGVFDGDPDDGGSLVETITYLTHADMGGGDAFAYSEDVVTYTKEFTSDSLIKATQQYDFDVDGRIKDTSTILLATDAIVKAIEEATITADGRIMATGQKDITVDSLVKSRLLEEFETDALITERTVKSITADGRIKDVVETTITTNADVVDRLVKEFMADGYIRATTDYGITADGRIKVVSTETFTVDGIIRFNVIGVTGEAFWIELIGKSKWIEVDGASKWIELVGKAKFNEGG